MLLHKLSLLSCSVFHFFALWGKVYKSVKANLEEESCAGIEGGEYDSYCPNRSRLERREAGEANLEVGFHPQPVPVRCSFCLCQSLPK